MEGLKRKTERDFGFKIKKWNLIKHINKSSYVARIVTKDGKKRALKGLYISPTRQHFITKSEQLLAAQGVKLARPLTTVKDNLYMIYNRDPYVLYEWIDGKNNHLRNPSDLEALVKVIARFHSASRKLEYPSEIKIYSHPHWEKEYKERIKSIENWYSDHKSSKKRKEKIILKYIPFFRKVANKAYGALKRSEYQAYKDGNISTNTLVHGDFHQMNLLFKNKVGFLLDFEDIRYDLPSKDLLRIFSMYLKKHRFSSQVFRKMLKTYEGLHPLVPEVKQLICIDFLFPHIFERMLRKKTYNRMDKKHLQYRINQEKRKASYIYRHFAKKLRNREWEGLF
ncbi:DUF1679 domain-containing protein [Paenibacillus psychroresistens]|uniref:DUF1679 domain-containing protein n=1 Tax=Paenibacillus psychroresistens TaxID=1778678 RepID=A0A6B8RFH8_9BACL|nr:phosphotransferase [Paenibacillus psychroresistens]QGQ94920.1 DUF1679 domain-containing protein [Paenibacillus psychroresistens]